jgi:hypothetical protein
MMRLRAGIGRLGWLLPRRLVGCAAMIAAALSVGVVIDQATAEASVPGAPWWHLSTRIFPSNLAPGKEGTSVLTAVNLGDGQVRGEPILTQRFPAGYSVQKIELFVLSDDQGKIELSHEPQGEGGPPFCEQTTTIARCDVDLAVLAAQGFNRHEPVLNPYEDVEMRVTVKNEGANGSSEQMSAEAEGGETPAARISQPLPTSEAQPKFGVEHFSMVSEEDGGGVDVQAGGHPFQLTSTVTVNEGPDQTRPLSMLRDLNISLPPGLVGNASRIPRCTDAELKELGEENGGIGFAATVNKCPAGSMVGAIVLTFDEPNLGGVVTNPVPIFNMVPNKGEPARFGFEVVQAPVFLDTEVRTGSDYGVTVDIRNITELVSFISATTTFWGVPGDERHDLSRGWPCFITGKWYTTGLNPPCVPALESQPPAFLSLPTACGRFATAVEGLSWPTGAAAGGETLPREESPLTDEFGRELGISGCNALRFEPSIDVTPEVSRPSSPTGMRVELKMPEEADETANGISNATVKDLTVSLPDGVAVNPSSAAGLEACSEAAVGYNPGQSLPPSSLSFSPRLPEGWEAGHEFCPSASKIGTVNIVSRLLPTGQALSGSVFLATQNTNPFGSLLALYIVAEDPVSGVAVKLAGEVSPDPGTGRLTTTLRNVPELPFETATLKFFGGPHAALATPATCGNYTTVVSAIPWSENVKATPTSQFAVGSPCASRRPFEPTLNESPQSIQAGAFTSLSTRIGVADGSQDLRDVALQLPPGVSGVLKGVKLCDEADANAGSCGPESLVGHATAQVGFGPEPFEVTGGQVFLTQGYRGAPFGLSIVTPAKAGPFDLGTVVVRARVEVDRHTAQIRVVTDSSGPYAIPTILDGIPLAIKQVAVTVDRTGFTFNPTNCSALDTTGSVGSDEGGMVAVSAPFRAANCTTLHFAPKFAVSTSGRVSRLNGVDLSVKLSYPKAAFGTQSEIARVKVQLPRQLPSRLETLHGACLAAVFEVDPAKCPARAVVGHARVTTPLLPVPLTGNAYFVSHGGEQFPSLTMVLSGYGVTIDLVGSTLIKKGITTTTFASVPDVPFETFELTLPKGRYSALGGFGNLCKGKLTMPIEYAAQNGAVLRQDPRIATTGCTKHKQSRRHSSHKRHQGKGKK